MKKMKAPGLLVSMITIVTLSTAFLLKEIRTNASIFGKLGLQHKEKISWRSDYLNESGTLQQDNENDTSISQLWGYLELDNATSYCDVVRRSRLYSTECNNLGEGSPRRILITSTGRSGTGFLEHLLRDVGLQVGHDNYGIPLKNSIHGAVSWVHAFNGDKCVYPSWAWRRRLESSQQQNRDGKDRRNFLHVLHIVRDPLQSIRSRWNMGVIHPFESTGRCNSAQQIKADHNSSKSKKDYALQETLRHWVLWNSFIESYTSRVIRTEELSGTIVHQIYDIAGEVNPDGESDMPSITKTVSEIDAILHNQTILTTFSNSGHTKKPGFNMTWDLLGSLNDPDYVVMAQLMARRYGYNISEELVQKNELYQKKQVCGFNTQNQWDCRVEFVGR